MEKLEKKMKSFMSRAVLTGLLLGTSMLAVAATPAPKGAQVFIVSPEDGATVPQEFKVKFGVKGIALAPAGDVTKNTGHHHLLVDVDKLPAAGAPIPTDANHMHFGKAQTEATIKLAPGKHTLQLELGDTGHIPFEPPIVSKKITVNVK
ncbi:protein of unknown function [Pseudomonas sp. NFACC32-1]|nr:protein of unknown function [Pseudomonas sp. NFACC32-1]SFW79718.1 protein of unknown function [Pseudomonas sp. NFACC09-4]SFX71630.1 protein of unknown function [Pseudomonas sp. NFACC36]SFX94810.1 protein of unknown function [Pseudomonas sp. NFACC43]SFX97291.1 protein of unknown function [Pseudomonas sp. NFACC49-2]SFY00832.1 protein of unknown function [Pseudomonas sp. NFACC47-1]SIS02996.1 protein of unknown function [Pseudomonas sp. 7SR1]